MTRMAWADVRPAAREAFAVWTSGSDLEWAKEAWARLGSAGLCDYQTTGERTRVAVRFLALASLYRDWCCLAFDECQQDEPASWAFAFDLDAIYLGQLVPDEDLPDDPDEAFESALRALMEEERSTVAHGLQTAYGGVARLFLALWRSAARDTDPDAFDDDEAPVEESDDEILNDVTAEKLRAYEWISGGCDSLQRHLD